MSTVEIILVGISGTAWTIVYLDLIRKRLLRAGHPVHRSPPEEDTDRSEF
ncbi:MAG: hypothetical protein ACI4W2_08450 [Eubacterium sp.]